MRKYALCVMFFVLLFVLLISGCMNLSNTGEIEIYLTDAVLPVSDIQKLDVTIDRILLMSDTEDASIVVTDEATAVNLLDLIGTEIGFPVIQAYGTFTQIRFEISYATITVNGQEYTLEINSDSLKYPFTEPIDVNEKTVIVLDFDLSRSIKYNGSWNSSNPDPSKFRVTPVVHVRYGKLYDINGRVVNSNNEGIVHALVALFDTEEATVVASTFTHKKSNNWEDGEFRILKIKPGKYELQIFKEETYSTWDDADEIISATPDATADVQVENHDINNIEILIE
ncbi:DUF4382 domain-containing protein [Pseudothermotoga elfii]|uniref:DUF4382 domain-containing protein n=1 Tax=Pseudothermotoga elfii TaxID=38322 RepID=UPI0004099C65|nr:DUF4382 domain-containing protein [Pseudothermotoga elfii]